MHGLSLTRQYRSALRSYLPSIGVVVEEKRSPQHSPNSGRKLGGHCRNPDLKPPTGSRVSATLFSRDAGDRRVCRPKETIRGSYTLQKDLRK